LDIVAVETRRLTGVVGKSPVSNANASPKSKASEWVLVVLAWLPVTIPLLWGIWQTVKKAAVLFR
jgi:hypothetical protein